MGSDPMRSREGGREGEGGDGDGEEEEMENRKPKKGRVGREKKVRDKERRVPFIRTRTRTRTMTRTRGQIKLEMCHYRIECSEGGRTANSTMRYDMRAKVHSPSVLFLSWAFPQRRVEGGGGKEYNS